MAPSVHAALRHLAADEPDRDLVRRFARDRDPDAFAALVRRHGPMVFGVCQRALGDLHLAEDPFQTVFLVFARRAGRARALLAELAAGAPGARLTVEAGAALGRLGR